MQGTTWGDMHGMPGFTRIRLGQHSTEKDLAEDWTMTHELVHMAFPSLPDEQHWMEEGLATYIEPIARVQAGELRAKQIWQDMIEGIPKGEPQPGDRGIDHTHSWGRTYWGGALFCLVADVNIRKQTQNRKGLRDALRAIVAAGGTIDHDWPLTKALEAGDKATGTTVLTGQYQQWSDSPSPVDLDKLWNELGVSAGKEGASFNSSAPLASIRESITAH
jgi:predicted metalloprotease with PDZ domain